MPRIARIIVPGVPHHIIQRGNRNQIVFFSNDDKRFYLRLLRKQAHIFKLKFWAYCLMDNHVHLVAVPETKESFQAIWETHRRYTLEINSRKDWRGHLWQGRFSSYPMDESYLYAAVRYVERNPVRAGIVYCAWQYYWSSAQFHVKGKNDTVVEPCFLQKTIQNWKAYLTESDDLQDQFRKHENTGRPLGSDDFLNDLSIKTGMVFTKKKPGPKPGSKRKLSKVSP